MENRNRTSKKSLDSGASVKTARLDKALFTALYAVFGDGAYCQKAVTDALRMLGDERSAPFLTRAFYGVLDNNVRFEKIVSSLCEKKPETDASTVLKIGLFYLRYADMPDYAAVNRAVDLAKKCGVFSGFINAVLKRSIGFEPKFASESEKFSYMHNCPEWLCKILISDYSEKRAADILDAVLPEKTHVRPIAGRISHEEFMAEAQGCQLTEYGAYCDKRRMSAFAPGTVTVQSYASAVAVNTYKKGIDSGDVIDLCAAPGGKSAYLYELGKFNITACDIYPHKIELIKKLAQKTGARLDPVLNDATVTNNEYVGKFDLVIADCPCSGTGTLKTKPDILLNRKRDDLDGLCEIQSKILDASCEYTKPGGILCYSTCSILKCENERIRDKFLSTHDRFIPLDEKKLMPDVDHCDGFYIARFRRRDI